MSKRLSLWAVAFAKNPMTPLAFASILALVSGARDAVAGFASGSLGIITGILLACAIVIGRFNWIRTATALTIIGVVLGTIYACWLLWAAVIALF